MKHYTRFRAYQLGECGASFSFSVNEHFTLIEARYNDYNKPHILQEMKNCGISRIDVLHITSWDGDHCQACELKNILLELHLALDCVIEEKKLNHLCRAQILKSKDM